MVQTETRRLAAIMFTDIVGFSRQMGANEARTLRLLEVHNQLIQQAVVAHHGHVIKSTGDGFLIDFPSVVHAVQCAQHLQAQLRAHNAEHETAEQIHIRIGIHLGDIVQQNGNVQGDGVNIAARLQTLAGPDTVCISDVVYRDVAQKVALGMVISLGRPKLKNITQRFPVYALLPERPKGVRQTLRVQRLKLSRRVGSAHRAVAAVLLLVGVGVLGSYLHLFPIPGQSQGVAPTTSQPTLPLPDKPSLVVLPFVNMSGDPGQEYFSDGITDTLITDLSKLSGLFLIARNSSFTYKGGAKKVEQIGRELGVRYVLEGSVQRAGERVRINAQLVDATTGHHLWAERYDRPLHDLFEVQDDITQRIVRALEVKVWEAELARVRPIPTENLNAYDAVLRGAEYYWRLTKEGNAQARQLFERAIELDSQYAEAHAWLGASYWLGWLYQWDEDAQNLRRAFEMAQQAIALDGSIVNAHLVMGHVFLHNRQYEQAIIEGERAVALAPNCAECYGTLGVILNIAGQPEEAIQLVERALRLDPSSPLLLLHTLGLAYYLLGRDGEAIVAFQKCLVIHPSFLPAHVALAGLYSLTGREKDARAEAEIILQISPDFLVEGLRQRTPAKDQVKLEHFLAALRKAGLK